MAIGRFPALGGAFSTTCIIALQLLLVLLVGGKYGTQPLAPPSIGALSAANADSLKKPSVKEASDSTKIVQTIHLEAGDAKLAKLLRNPCDTFSVEIDGLYPILTILPNAMDETCMMTQKLKKKGFTINQGGRGNWQYGPRILTFSATKGAFKCTIYKLYYTNEEMPDGYFNLRVTEKVICNTSRALFD